MRLTWKREPRAKGLMAVGQGALGYELRIDGVSAGSVFCVGRSAAHGWAWSVATNENWAWSVATNEQHGIMWRSSYVETHKGMPLEDAKAACKAYVIECLKRRATEASRGE